MHTRPLRFSEEIRRCLSLFLFRGGGAALVTKHRFTITHVRVSPDLRIADIYIECPRKVEKKVINTLVGLVPDMMDVIAREVYARRLPRLRFHRDNAQDNARHIDTILSRDRVRRDLAAAPQTASKQDISDQNGLEDARGGARANRSGSG